MSLVHPQSVVRTWPELLFEIFLWVVVPVGLLMLYLSVGGCKPEQVKIASEAADLTMKITNEEVLKMNDIETAEGDKCIHEQPTMVEIQKCMDGVRAKWKPVWDGVRLFNAAHDIVADELESGGLPPLGDLKTAYCALRKVAPPPIVLPDIPLMPCAVTP